MVQTRSSMRPACLERRRRFESLGGVPARLQYGNGQGQRLDRGATSAEGARAQDVRAKAPKEPGSRHKRRSDHHGQVLQEDAGSSGMLAEGWPNRYTPRPPAMPAFTSTSLFLLLLPARLRLPCSGLCVDSPRRARLHPSGRPWQRLSARAPRACSRACWRLSRAGARSA